MKRFLAIALTASLGLFAGSAIANTSYTDYNAGDAANGIGQSRHNLGSLGVHVIASETTQICVFCHTPHHTNTSAAPLWNRPTGADGSYTAYGTTLAGTHIADGDLGATTLACLSCHDGVTTFDNLVNRPGKDTKGGDMGWTWTEDGGTVSDFMTSGRLNIMEGDGTTTGAGLSNDHPISVVYYGNEKASLRDANTDIAGIDLASNLGSTNGNIMQNAWAVAGFISTTASINDILRDGKVECSSCHDPHFSNKSWDEVESTWDPTLATPTYGTSTTAGDEDADGLFLRRVGGNTGSGVCRTCHNK